MNINSLSCLVGSLLLAVVYYLVPGKFQWIVLLLASFGFYYLADTGSVFFIVLISIFAYVSALIVERYKEQKQRELDNVGQEMSRVEKKEYTKKVDKYCGFIVTICVVMVLGVLAIVKYSDFLVNIYNRLMPVTKFEIDYKSSIMVPLGISYVTLQNLGYVFDVSKGKAKAEKNPLKYMLFGIYFPQITQGPIGRYSDLAPQFFEKHKYIYENIKNGCISILWGLFLKMVIADRLKPLVTEIYSNYSEYSGMTLLIAGMWMSIQVYADFSGYMCIASGISKWFGIELAENFNRPFASKTLAEYWRRWHITLSSWFRDYLFYPISFSNMAVKAGKKARKILPQRIAKMVPSVVALSVVWFATGLWHDSSWRYVLWGIANGVIIISAMCMEPYFERTRELLNISVDNRFFQVFQVARTFCIVGFLKVFPGAPDTGSVFIIINRIIFDFDMRISRNTIFPTMKKFDVLVLIYGLVLMAVVSGKIKEMEIYNWLNKKNILIRYAVYLLIIFSILALGVVHIDTTGGFEYAKY